MSSLIAQPSQFILQSLVSLGVRRRQIEPHVPAVIKDTIRGERQILGGQPKIQ